MHLFTGVCQNVNCPHGHSINSYYQNIVDPLLTSANTHVHTIKSDALKPFWSDALSDRKLAAIEA